MAYRLRIGKRERMAAGAYEFTVLETCQTIRGDMQWSTFSERIMKVSNMKKIRT